MENEFKYIGTWGDGRGDTNVITIYHTMHPQFMMKIGPFVATGKLADKRYEAAKTLVALLNEGLRQRPDLVEPYIIRPE
jgi:hypothetical protein